MNDALEGIQEEVKPEMQGYYKLELLFGCTVNGMYGENEDKWNRKA